MRLSLLLVLALSFLSCAPRSSVLLSPPAGERPQVVIVGGGLSGLVAAHALEKQGVTVHLLERDTRLGGRVRTVSYGEGLEAEAGLQELWEKNPLTGLAKELGLTLESDVPFSSMQLAGKLELYVQDSDEAFLDALFSAEERKAQKAWLAAAERLYLDLQAHGLSAEHRRLQSLSFAEWLAEGRLPPRVKDWIRLTIECELAASSTEFSALYGLMEFRVFLFGGEKANHLVGGNQKLISALSARIRGPKTLGAQVVSIVKKEERWTVSYLRENTLEHLQADRVLVTVPWTVLPDLRIEPPLPDALWASLRSLGKGQYVKVHLIVDTHIRDLWKALPETPFPILTDSPLGVIYGLGSAPRSAQEVFTLLVYGENAKRLSEAPRAEGTQGLVNQLEALWPGFARYVVDSHAYVYRPAAVAFFPKGRSPLDAEGQKAFESMGGLYLAGDYLLSSHSDGAAESALRQAKAIAEDLVVRPR